MGKGVSGTLVGTGSENNYLSRFYILYEQNDIEKNDTVVTSGYDGIFPPDIEVGYILTEKHKQTGIFYEYELVPAVDFSKVEQVLILTGRDPVEGNKAVKDGAESKKNEKGKP